MKMVTQHKITYFDYDALDLPEGKFTKVATTSPSLDITDFSRKLLRTAAVWEPSGEPCQGFGTWRPLDPQHHKCLLAWLHDEFIANQFTVVLELRNFLVPWEPYLGCDHTFMAALTALIAGAARVSIHAGVPVLLGARITTNPQILVLGDLASTDRRISWIHNKLTAAAQCTRPHSQGEIDALLAWADNEFAVAGVDSIMFPQGNDCRYLSDPPEPPAKENAQALVSVSRGCCHVEWTGTTAVFEQPPELYRPGQNFGLKTPASIASALAMRERHRVIRFLNAISAQTAGCLQTH